MFRSVGPRLSPAWPLVTVLAGLLLTATALLSPRPAAASEGWCAGDPVIAINGTIVTIESSVFGEPVVVDKNVAAAYTTVHVPPGTSVQTLLLTTSFFKEKKVTVVTDLPTPAAGAPVPVRVEVRFKAKLILPTRLTVDHVERDTGTTATTLTATFTVAASAN